MILDIDMLKNPRESYGRNALVWDNLHNIVTLRFLNGAAAYAAMAPVEEGDVPGRVPPGRDWCWFNLLRWEPC